MNYLDEDEIERWVWEDVFADIGWTHLHGSDIAPGGDDAERASWTDVVLPGRLRDAVDRLNPGIPPAQQADAVRTLMKTVKPELVEDNADVHAVLLNGVTVLVMEDGAERNRTVRFIDWDDADNNDFAIVRQFRVDDLVKGKKTSRRLDLVGFVNGVPLMAGELKTAKNEKATVKSAYRQFQTYKAELPSLLRYNAVLVCSDGTDARAGSLTAGFEHFAPWRTIDGDKDSGHGKSELEVLVRGLFPPQLFLTYVRDYISFSDEKDGLVKRCLKYHQFWAVEKAVARTLEAVEGDGRAGVVWHTQGSGKSEEMKAYVAKIMRHSQMDNPTVVLLTDRNDLDNQLHDDVFMPSVGRGFLPEKPQQADTRENLRTLLQRPSGGIIFTTIQKFGLTKAERDAGTEFPLLTDRSNVVVVADEAHRSQYDFIDGFARHMRDGLPNATFLGFTGTPISFDDKDTQAVFGEYIDIYDITAAIEDGATVPILYESRLVAVTLSEEDLDALDTDIDTAAEDIAPYKVQKAKRRWAKVEAVIGADQRLQQVAEDLLEHWDERRSVLAGKAMFVAMSREIAVQMYDRIVALRPDWHHEDDDKGTIKVVMTGAADDPKHYQPHLRSKKARDALKRRLKDADDSLQMVIVVDMWLTGMDAPPLHTMYIDKPMKGHGLMQAIARVNRTWKDKPAGLIVDFVGITDNLRRAVDTYTERDQDKVGVDIEEGALEMQRYFEIVEALLHGCPWKAGAHSPDTGKRLSAVADTAEWLLAHDEQDDNGKTLVDRFLDYTLALTKAQALAGSHPKVKTYANDIAFFASVRARLLKLTSTSSHDRPGSAEHLDTVLQAVVSAAIAADGVVDLFAEAGVPNPNLSVLSDEFLENIKSAQGYEHSRLEVLRKLLSEEVQSVRRENVVQYEKFSDQLRRAVAKYKARAISAATAIDELVNLAKQMTAAKSEAQAAGLKPEEWAFYQAVADHGPALTEMGDDKLKALASELVLRLRDKVTIDWQRKESVQAGIRTTVKVLLAQRGYPPEYSEEAIDKVLQQTALFAEKWSDS